ncbi:flagellar biosynthesis anti-sigma factor FlgM [Stutzerimonas kunmingensis]|uniref:flagellar biosynthesis anti-sigma factor FlgM n=1 Tax=Stutzerimonas stutzeri subgroup TaxID=578833 RepID=UPI0015CA60FF|nr:MULTISPECIES: flagellar biosynthesis anti-sigma factor FlgM [Stutzerimonas stutzeri subgroup]UEG61360.1 flagellar biosynthesis anti-sigma factor FlgM [Stutzerimonas chloritidismutans]
MEISRHFKPALTPAAEASTTRQPASRPLADTAVRQSESLPLEQMHDALRAMPDVDLDRVAAIKQALQRGEISTDPAELAGSMLAYHRGSDA